MRLDLIKIAAAVRMTDFPFNQLFLSVWVVDEAGCVVILLRELLGGVREGGVAKISHAYIISFCS